MSSCFLQKKLVKPINCNRNGQHSFTTFSTKLVFFFAQFPWLHHFTEGDHLMSIERISSETASMWLPSVCSVIQTRTSTVSSSPEYKFGILWLENLRRSHPPSAGSPCRSRPWLGTSRFHTPLPPPCHRSCAASYSRTLTLPWFVKSHRFILGFGSNLGVLWVTDATIVYFLVVWVECLLLGLSGHWKYPFWGYFWSPFGVVAKAITKRRY